MLCSSILTLACVTQTGIPLDTEWKQHVYSYAEKHIVHSAWGLAHAERNYHMSLKLAAKENIHVDNDVIFAASFLHDIGAIDCFRKKEVEHSIRSVELSEGLLKAYRFPMKKWPSVKAAILGHMYYAEKPVEADAIVFHDADALDFLGTIGIARIISITERHGWAENLKGAFETLKQFKETLPQSLITVNAKKIAEKRIHEMEQVFSFMNQETFQGKAI